MIVRGRPSALRLFLILRGSILHRIWQVLLVNIFLATLVTLNHGDLFRLKITLTAIPFTLIGLPIAIFLGFRNNSAYDRYWEGRKQWGEVVIHSRNFSRQCLSLIYFNEPLQAHTGLDDVRRRMIYRTMAFAHALRHLLRDTKPTNDLKPLLTPEELEQSEKFADPPNYIILQQGQDMRLCMNEQRLEPCLAVALESSLSSLTSAAAACERIKSTPIPFSYTLMLHRTAYLYCFLLPFGLVDTLGFMTPVVVGIVAYTFFGLDALGDEIEEPFGTTSNDLALEAICRSIEIDLRESIGEKHGLEPLKPVNFCLS